MKVALLGGGGREHALAWKITQSKKCSKLYSFSDNPGINQLSQRVALDPSNFEEFSTFIKKEKIDFVMVGPENYLVDGMVDHLTAKGIKAFGPVKAAAMMEGSKAFAKEIMDEAGVPTASYKVFTTVTAAKSYIVNQGVYPIVLKADGLCAGKGVLIAENQDEALAYIQSVLGDKAFGEAGAQLVIEEFMQGEEVSIFALSDGKTVKYLSSAQDHKKIFAGDKGPNTGGMGAYAPTSLINSELMVEIDQRIIQPVLNTLKAKGIVYKGVLYAGLMMTCDGPKVVEFNCRFGDPETQVLMPLLESDFMDILDAVTNERLAELDIRLSSRKAVCFVAASGGYPGTYTKGKVIHGLENAQSLIFFAGAKQQGNDILSDGGRVLNIVQVAPSIKEAREKALLDLERVAFEGMQYRKDIAHRELSRPLVSVLMGSDSDLPVLGEALKIFDELEIPYSVNIYSAHRTPSELKTLIAGWKYQNVKVAIAAAGMAAHLPGVVASLTDIPVIGIPLDATFNGLDALYSIVQMPGGVPVATMSVGKAGAKNAAILTLQILSLSDEDMAKCYKAYKAKQKKAVLEKNKLLQEIGYQKYIERKY